jgi:hypothetical protein
MDQRFMQIGTIRKRLIGLARTRESREVDSEVWDELGEVRKMIKRILKSRESLVDDSEDWHELGKAGKMIQRTGTNSGKSGKDRSGN